METFEITKKILKILSSQKEADILELKNNIKLTEPILPYLLWLEEMNFVKKKSISDKFKLIFSRWNITKSGKAYLEFLSTSERISKPQISKITLAYVCPSAIDKKIKGSGVHLVDILEDLFSTAKTEIIISSPYIDPVIIPFLKKVKSTVKVSILTQNKENFLVRLESENKNIVVKSLREFKDGVQLYQLHAKFICVDEQFCLIGSANLNERSIYHNFEMGVLIEDKYLCANLKDIFFSLFENQRD